MTKAEMQKQIDELKQVILTKDARIAELFEMLENAYFSPYPFWPLTYESPQYPDYTIWPSEYTNYK